jgi:hypothetical protein
LYLEATGLMPSKFCKVTSACQPNSARYWTKCKARWTPLLPAMGGEVVGDHQNALHRLP